jgi:phenylpyruvate tautomerase PptA (4-oxalocrotonate tautomerase family)
MRTIRPYRDSVPIIEIHALPPGVDLDVTSALIRVTTAVAAFLDEDPRGTWAIWRPVAPGAYAEGTEAPAVQPRGSHPAIVDVFAGPQGDVTEFLREVGRAVAGAFGLDDVNVVVRLTEADPTCVYWGE